MAAALFLTQTSGVNCPKTAGVKELYIAPLGAVTSITAGNNHDVTDMEFDTAGDGFGRIYFKRGECEITEAAENVNEVIINFAVPNPTATQRKELQAIKTTCESLVVARLYDRDELLLIGWDALAEFEAFASFQTFDSTTGRAKTDDALFNFNLRAEHEEILRPISGLSSVAATTTAAIVTELLAATNV